MTKSNSPNHTNKLIGNTEEPTTSWLPIQRSLVDRMVRDSGNIDVFVVRGVHGPAVPNVDAVRRRSSAGVLRWLGTGAILVLATSLALAVHGLGFSEANLVMIYLLAVVTVAVRYGALPSVAASVLSVLLFDLLFTAPLYWITVQDTQYLLTFAVMLIVGLLAGTLTTRVRYQADVARRNERRTEALYRLSRRLTAVSKTFSLVEEAEKSVGEVFEAHAVIFLPDDQGKIRPSSGMLRRSPQVRPSSPLHSGFSITTRRLAAGRIRCLALQRFTCRWRRPTVSPACLPSKRKASGNFCRRMPVSCSILTPRRLHSLWRGIG
jgi:two-component system sensor histidine kinase KdpD